MPRDAKYRTLGFRRPGGRHLRRAFVGHDGGRRCADCLTVAAFGRDVKSAFPGNDGFERVDVLLDAFRISDSALP